MSKGAVQEYGVNTLEGMNKAGGGTNKPKKATVRAATGGALVPTFSGGGQVPTFSGGGQVEDKKEKKGGLMGGITKKIMKIMDAGAMKGAMIGTVMFGPIGGIIGGGLGAVGSVIDERIAQVTGAGGSGKSADQLINNPPGQNDSGGDKDVITPVSGDNASSSPSQEEEAAPPPLFSALDERNLSTLVTKSMYSVIS
jgi:hypothetical protein